MKKVLWTKLFYFSASFSKNTEVHGHNYTLAVTLRFSGKLDEVLVEEAIEKALIQKIHSRDLGRDVDFLKNVKITDLNLLKVFSEIISREIRPIRIERLSLRRDPRTELCLE